MTNGHGNGNGTGNGRGFSVWRIVEVIVAAAILGVSGMVISNDRQQSARIDTLSATLIELNAWRQNQITANTVPRQEIDLRERLIFAEIAQLRARLEIEEKRREQP